jgi:transcriptional regulator with XRE-family HTH domain
MLTFYEMVGQRIIERLNELEWTQQNLADRLNISKQVMSKILKGEKNTTILEIKNIAENLSLSVDKLLSPINEKIELIKQEKCSIVPEFMGNVSTEDGRIGINKAMNIIETILGYENAYDNTNKIRNERIDFSGFEKKRTFNPNI